MRRLSLFNFGVKTAIKGIWHLVTSVLRFSAELFHAGQWHLFWSRWFHCWLLSQPSSEKQLNWEVGNTACHWRNKGSAWGGSLLCTTARGRHNYFPLPALYLIKWTVFPLKVSGCKWFWKYMGIPIHITRSKVIATCHPRRSMVTDGIQFLLDVWAFPISMSRIEKCLVLFLVNCYQLNLPHMLRNYGSRTDAHHSPVQNRAKCLASWIGRLLVMGCPTEKTGAT